MRYYHYIILAICLTVASLFAFWPDPEPVIVAGVSDLSIKGGEIDIINNDGEGAHWRRQRLIPDKIDPGFSGITQTVLGGSTPAWLMNDLMDRLFYVGSIPSDWTADGPVVVVVRMALAGAASPGDEIRAELLFEYCPADGNLLSPHTQTRTVARDVGTRTADGDVHVLYFHLEHDLPGKPVEHGNIVGGRLGLYDVGPGAAAVYFLSAVAQFRTSRTGPSIVVFPEEG